MPSAGPSTQPHTKISAMDFLLFNVAITPGIFAWSPMVARFDTVKTNINGENMVSRNCMTVLTADVLLVNPLLPADCPL